MCKDAIPATHAKIFTGKGRYRMDSPTDVQVRMSNIALELAWHFIIGLLLHEDNSTLNWRMILTRFVIFPMKLLICF